MVIAQVSIAPIGVGTSLSKYVKIALDVFRRENIHFETNAMGTVIETEDVGILFDVIKKAHEAVISTGVKRVITEIKIDDRRDKKATINTKLASLK
ncbi:MAG: MTH1187 family thiamine-binding protein [Candidatus Thermoplasmatota archaeon]